MDKNNNKILMAYAVALSQMNGVKPMVVDCTYKALADLHNGQSVEQTVSNMQANINEQLKFQNLLDGMKPLYDSFIDHFNDREYTLYIYTDETDEERAYYDDDFYEKLTKERENRNNTYIKLKDEVDAHLKKLGFAEGSYTDSQIEWFVKDFYQSQTRAYSFYKFSKELFEDNKQNIFDQTPMFVASKDTAQFVSDLEQLANSSLVYLLEKTNSFNNGELAVRQYLNKIDAIMRSKAYLSFCNNDKLRGDIRKNITPVEAMMRALVSFDGELDEPSTEFVNLFDDIGKTLYFERLLANKTLTEQKMGESAKRLKVYEKRLEDGRKVRRAIIEKGDLMHWAQVEDGRLDDILNDNCLMPHAVQSNKYAYKRFGDASAGGVHCLQVPVDYSDLDVLYKSDDRKEQYYGYFSKRTYNDYGNNLGFVFDESVAEQNGNFEQMHFLEDFVADERRQNVCKVIVGNSSNYYSYIKGAMYEKDRLINDRCYFLGMPLCDVKCLVMGDGVWKKVRDENVEQIQAKIGDRVPLVVNGELVNNPSAEKIEVVDEPKAKDSESENDKGEK